MLLAFDNHICARRLLPPNIHAHTTAQVLQGLDAQPTPTLALKVALRGVFAGNIFDLGAAASAERYESGQGAGFHCALDQLLPRPWVSSR